jgi:hypothetical protein
MKRIMLSFVVLALLISNYAYAATYTYTGSNFTTVAGVYTTNMRITGIINTSPPIPPNSSSLDISPILTSWSFNDGVSTISSANGIFFKGEIPRFSTDGEGNITGYHWLVISSPVIPAIGDLNDLIMVTETKDSVLSDLVCNSLTDGFCSDWSLGASHAETSIQGVWATSTPSTPVPTLSQWSLMLLALMLGLVGVLRVRRQV